MHRVFAIFVIKGKWNGGEEAEEEKRFLHKAVAWWWLEALWQKGVYDDKGFFSLSLPPFPPEKLHSK